MATLSQRPPRQPQLDELESIGVIAATFPSVALFAAANGVTQRPAHAQQRPARSPTCTTRFSRSRYYYDLVGLKPLLAREEAYDQAAAALTQSAPRSEAAHRRFAKHFNRNVQKHGAIGAAQWIARRTTQSRTAASLAPEPVPLRPCRSCR